LPVLKLTKATITRLGKGDKPAVYYDSDLKGFGLKIFPSGERRWILEYRPGAAGRAVAKRRMVIGSANLLAPEAARKHAAEALAQIRLGKDPVQEKTRLRESATVCELLEAYMAREVKPLRKPSTVSLYQIYIDRHLKPSIGSRKAASLGRTEVAKLHRSIGLKKAVTANRVVTFLHAAYSWGIKRHLLPKGSENPCNDIEKFAEKFSERFLSHDEFARLGEALRAAETTGIEWEPVDLAKPNAKHASKDPAARRTVLGPHAVAAIRLLIFTGARLREILHLRWEEVDLDRGILLLPDSKTGKKTIALNAPAAAILEGIPQVGSYVIAGENPEKPRSDLKRPWELVARHAQLHGIRLHDLRHSFASVGVGQSLGLPIIGKLLGHKNTNTTERYAHLGVDPLRESSNAIARQIAQAMGDVVEPVI